MTQRMIQEVSSLLDHAVRRALAGSNLGLSQFTLLTILGYKDQARLTDLSDEMLVSKSTVTRLVDQLEEAGYVHRISDPVDRRAQQVTLTPAGQAELEQASAAYAAVLPVHLAVLPRAERQELERLLGKLRSSLFEALDNVG